MQDGGVPTDHRGAALAIGLPGQCEDSPDDVPRLVTQAAQKAANEALKLIADT